MSDTYNMSIRKFLKQVGVTGQQAIEDGLRKAGSNTSHKVKMVLTVESLGINHVVTGTLESDAAGSDKA